MAYELLIDSMPGTAVASMRLMIGIALGLSGSLVAPVAGWIIQNFGFTAYYMTMAALLALSFVPMSFLKETVVN